MFTPCRKNDLEVHAVTIIIEESMKYNLTHIKLQIHVYCTPIYESCALFTCVHVCVYIYICAYMHGCACVVSMHLYVCVCVCVFDNVHVHACAWVCVHVTMKHVCICCRAYNYIHLIFSCL